MAVKPASCDAPSPEGTRVLLIPDFETGLYLDEFPYLRIGRGAGKLVVLPGLGDGLQDVRKGPRRTAWFYRRYTRDFTVFLVSRRRGLHDGMTIGLMADDYARVMTECIGPASVMGISMGGLIAEDLAAECPHLVRRLVLAATAHRAGPNGEELGGRWIAWAREGRWPDVCRELAEVTFNGCRKGLYTRLLPLLVRCRGQKPANPADFATSVRACLTHDAAERLSSIQAPTLVIAGTRDGFFPEVLIREMAKHIPDVQVFLMEGTGHGLFVERKRRFDRIVAAFLSDRA